MYNAAFVAFEPTEMRKKKEKKIYEETNIHCHRNISLNAEWQLENKKIEKKVEKNNAQSQSGPMCIA